MPDRSTTENKVVELYLHYLATDELPVDPDREAKQEALDNRITSEERLHIKVQLIAERQALEGPSMSARELEARFIDYGATFSVRTGVTYQAWRAMGVKPKVIKQLGVKAPSHPHKAKAADEGRDYSHHRKPRHKRTPEFAIAVFQLYLSKPGEEGHRLVAEQYGYKNEHAAVNVLSDLSKRYPKEAATCGYVHSEHTMSPEQSLALAHAASMKKMAS